MAVEGYGGDGGARRELAPSTVMAGSQCRGCRCCGRVDGEGGAGNAKVRAHTGAGGSWGGNAVLRRVMACVVRAAATRGHHGFHVVAMS